MFLLHPDQDLKQLGSRQQLQPCLPVREHISHEMLNIAAKNGEPRDFVQCIAYLSVLALTGHGRLSLCPALSMLPGLMQGGRGLILTLQRFAAQQLNCNCPSLRTELSQN